MGVKTVAMKLAEALDPVAFAERLGITPDPWQTQVLRSSAKRIIINCGRQTGKSTVAAILGLHTAIFRPGSLVLLLSPSLRQSSELFRKVADFYRKLGHEGPEPEAWSALRLELSNSSRIVSLPGKEQTVRGFSGVQLLIVDEAARVPDELYFAVRPMLAVSDGRLVILSTPFGKSGFFYQTWTEGGPEWLKIHVRASDCPRISKTFLDEERRALHPWVFSQEYEASFEDAQTALIHAEALERAVSAEVELWRL